MIVIRTEWSWTTESIAETAARIFGQPVVRVYRTSGLWADVRLQDGTERHVYDGQQFPDCRTHRVGACELCRV